MLLCKCVQGQLLSCNINNLMAVRSSGPPEYQSALRSSTWIDDITDCSAQGKLLKKLSKISVNLYLYFQVERSRMNFVQDDFTWLVWRRTLFAWTARCAWRTQLHWEMMLGGPLYKLFTPPHLFVKVTRSWFATKSPDSTNQHGLVDELTNQMSR